MVYEPVEPAGAGQMNELVGLLLGVVLPSTQGLVVLALFLARVALAHKGLAWGLLSF